MTWESIGSVDTGDMPNDEAWIVMSLELARRYITFACGEAPEGSKLEIMWHEHELGTYPSLGVWCEYDHPWGYINACERALEAFNDAVAWDSLKTFVEEQIPEDDSEHDDDQIDEADETITTEVNTAQDFLDSFRSKAQRCAHEMLSNAAYVLKELQSMEIQDVYRSRIADVCAALVGSKHDVVSELSELEEIDANVDSPEVQRRVQRIVDWSGEELPKLHSLVQSLEPVADSKHENGLVYLLIAESAANILRSFVEMSDAADQYFKAVEGTE